MPALLCYSVTCLAVPGLGVPCTTAQRLARHRDAYRTAMTRTRIITLLSALALLRHAYLAAPCIALPCLLALIAPRCTLIEDAAGCFQPLPNRAVHRRNVLCPTAPDGSYRHRKAHSLNGQTAVNSP